MPRRFFTPRRWFLAVVPCLLLLTGADRATAGGPRKLSDGLALARALPARWLGLSLLADKEYGRKKIAQMEISFARAEYVSADNTIEGSIEIVDTLRSPMHLNDFDSARKNAPAERMETWREGGLEGYLIQDPDENETRAGLLVAGRWVLTLTHSPRTGSLDMRVSISSLVASKAFQNFLARPE